MSAEWTAHRFRGLVEVAAPVMSRAASRGPFKLAPGQLRGFRQTAGGFTTGFTRMEEEPDEEPEQAAEEQPLPTAKPPSEVAAPPPTADVPDGVYSDALDKTKAGTENRIAKLFRAKAINNDETMKRARGHLPPTLPVLPRKSGRCSPSRAACRAQGSTRRASSPRSSARPRARSSAGTAS